MTTKHTQGEWKFNLPSNNSNPSVTIPECKWEDGLIKGRINTTEEHTLVLADTGQGVADAKLIASAPALLEALIDIDKYCSKNLCTKHRCMITSAIKQATE